jgi:hypothetical protein
LAEVLLLVVLELADRDTLEALQALIVETITRVVEVVLVQ